jgi:Protein of unknown function (DUF5132)
MPKRQGAADVGNGQAEHMQGDEANEETSVAEEAEEDARRDDLVAGAATVGIICVGAALFEAALIPGMIIGVAAMLAPKALPRVSGAIEPAFRGAVRGVYKIGQKARHAAAEAQEQVRDIVAEENAEEKAPAGA